MRFYERVLRFDCGARMAFGRTDRLGYQLSFGGDALREAYAMHGVDAFSILDNMHHNARNITRVDMYVDALNSNLSISELASEDGLAKLTTPSRTPPTYIRQASGTGEGLYVGSMKKRTRLARIYDKGAELRLEDYKIGSHIRIEMQCQQKHARASTAAILASDEPAIAIPAIIKNFCDFDTDEWRAVLGDTKMRVVTDRSVPSDETRWIWLRDAVAPAMAKFFYRHPHLVGEYREILDEEYRKVSI